MTRNRRDILNYPRKLLVRLSLLIIILNIFQESYRHYQMSENFKAMRRIALRYDGEAEREKMLKEEEKRIVVSDTINVSLMIVKLSGIMGILLFYDKRYYNIKPKHKKSR